LIKNCVLKHYTASKSNTDDCAYSISTFQVLTSKWRFKRVTNLTTISKITPIHMRIYNMQLFDRFKNQLELYSESTTLILFCFLFLFYFWF